MIEAFLNELAPSQRGPAKRSVLAGGDWWQDFVTWAEGDGRMKVVHSQPRVKVWDAGGEYILRVGKEPPLLGLTANELALIVGCEPPAPGVEADDFWGAANGFAQALGLSKQLDGVGAWSRGESVKYLRAMIARLERDETGAKGEGVATLLERWQRARVIKPIVIWE